MADHYEVPIALIIGYLLMVWIGQNIMADRKQGYNLSSVTVAWNMALSLFSAAGFYHVARAFVASGMQHGFLNQGGVLCRCLAPHSALPPASLRRRRDVQFDNHWVALFCLSKVPELVDTALLILQAWPP
jgi:elongation of very long chain fatty acids protein 6